LNSRKKRFLYSLLFLLGLAAVIALILIKGPLAPVNVQVTKVSKGSLHPSRFGVGTVEALRSYTIGPNRSGRLLELTVDQGDRVSKGQLLGRMDPVDLPDRLRSAEKAIEKMQHMIMAAEARLSEVEARLRLARDDARRYRELGKKKQVSVDQVEARETEARALSDQYRGAQADLDVAQHDLEKAKADRDGIQALINDLNLTSPAPGLVIAREVEPGSVVMAGSPVLKIVDPATLWVRTRIDQLGSAVLHQGLAAEILLRKFPTTPLTGKVSRLELIADSLTEERWVDVAFEQIPDDIAIGSLANVTIRLAAIEDVLWIPAAALHRKEGHAGVWVLDQERARFRSIETGVRTLDGRVQVTAGLAEGAEVISYSARPLEDGAKLRAENR